MIIFQIFIIISSYVIVCYMGYSICRACHAWKIKSIMTEIETFKNTCTEYMDQAKEELGKSKDIIERQNHLIEMLKMRTRER